MRVVRGSGETQKGRRVGHCLLGEGWGDAAGWSIWIYSHTISIGLWGKGGGCRGNRLTFIVFGSWLVDDGAVFETSEIEHADTAVGAAGDEDVDAVGAETHVEDFFVVGDELGLCGECRDIPDGASCVNGGCNDERWRDCVPIEGSKRCGMLWCLGIG